MPRLPVTRPVLISLMAVGALASAAIGAFADHLWVSSRARAAGAMSDTAPQTRALYRHRVDLFGRLASGSTVVMLGDSITQGGEWSELIGPQAANRGVGGDTSAGLLARLDASLPASARTVVVMIGTNDLKADDWTPQASAANVSALLDRLKGRRVILQSVLHTADAQANRKIDDLNSAYRTLCETARCEWLDLNPVVAPGGVLSREDSLDGRHLNGAAYLRWAALLKTRLG